MSGELSNDGAPMRRFMQTFVLVPLAPKKYYVRNDIFRYQDEVFHDQEELQEEEEESETEEDHFYQQVIYLTLRITRSTMKYSQEIAIADGHCNTFSINKIFLQTRYMWINWELCFS